MEANEGRRATPSERSGDGVMTTRKSEVRYQVNILVSVLVLALLTRVSARCDLTDVATVQGASEPSRVVGVERALVFASAPARRPRAAAGVAIRPRRTRSEEAISLGPRFRRLGDAREGA